MDSWLVSVDKLPPEGKTYALVVSADDLAPRFVSEELTDVEAVEEIRGEVRLVPSGRDVFVIGSTEGRVRYRCVRCLKVYGASLEAQFHLVCVRGEEAGSREQELHREDLEVEVLRNGTLNLLDLVLEQVDLAFDPHPLCREDCRGLCPECGADLNSGDCNCTGTAADPRLAVLEKWVRKDRG